MLKKCRDMAGQAGRFWRQLEPAGRRWLYLLSIGTIFGVGVMLGGCRPAGPETASYARALPQGEYPAAAGEEFPPEVICLRPGQTALLLRETVVEARVPFAGEELHVGKVKLSRGTLLAWPAAE